MDLGPILSALGQSFAGYGQGQQIEYEHKRQLALDQANNAWRDARSQDALAQTQQRTDRDAQDRMLRSPQFLQDYTDAQNGDQGALARVIGAAAGNPNMQSILSPLLSPKPPKTYYDPSRGVTVNAVDNTWTAPTGPGGAAMPARQKTPDELQTERLTLEQKAGDRAAASQRLQAARDASLSATSNLNEARAAVPRPSKVPGANTVPGHPEQMLNTAGMLNAPRGGPKPEMFVPNPAYQKAYQDSVAYEANTLQPARRAQQQANQNVIDLAGGRQPAESPAVQAPAREDPASHARKLRQSGLKGPALAAQMQADGYKPGVDFVP